MDRQAEHDIRRKTKVLEHAQQSGNISHTCRKYGVSRDTFYRWKRQMAVQRRWLIPNHALIFPPKRQPNSPGDFPQN